jgi:hypothetical protein
MLIPALKNMVTKTKTETIKTSSGTFKCQVIELTELTETPKSMLGTRATDEDYDRLIQENTVVYVNGKRAVVFLKKAMTTLLDIAPDSDSYAYWRWVSRDLYASQRGIVGGKEYNTEVGRRFTNGQIQFFRLCKKGKFEEAVAALADKTFSQYFFYINVLEKTPYFEMDVLSEIASKLRKKSTPAEEKERLYKLQDEERLKWFDRWFKDWEKAEDKKKFAEETFKKYASAQTYQNNVYSNVLGVLDRSARIPFGRWTSSTQRKFEQFVAHEHIYQQASLLYKETMPEEWEYIHDIMKECKDPAYTLLNTKTFSTITINWNFETYYHYDGRNNDRGVAVLTALSNETEDGEKFDGSYFVMPALRMAFDIRKGDFLVGDNQGLMHGQTVQRNKVDDADNIIYVFYARQNMTKLETLDVECCRKEFIQFAKKNLADKYRKHEGGNFMGVWGGMWLSDEWQSFKAEHCPGASNTNYWFTEE